MRDLHVAETPVLCYENRMRMAILLAFFAYLSTICSPRAYATTPSLFAMHETFSPDISRFEKWTSASARRVTQAAWPSHTCGQEAFHPCHTQEWTRHIHHWKTLALPARLDAVNTYANTTPYIIDMMNWGVEDFWATPYEFMVRDGDCEDYAIAKYVSLRRSGVPASRLRIMVVQDLNLGGVIHAILGVYDEGHTLYILDNQIKQVVRADHVYHYKPIYGINEQGWWAYTPRAIGG